MYEEPEGKEQGASSEICEMCKRQGALFDLFSKPKHQGDQAGNQKWTGLARKGYACSIKSQETRWERSMKTSRVILPATDADSAQSTDASVYPKPTDDTTAPSGVTHDSGLKESQ